MTKISTNKDNEEKVIDKIQYEILENSFFQKKNREDLNPLWYTCENIRHKGKWIPWI